MKYRPRMPWIPTPYILEMFLWLVTAAIVIAYLVILPNPFGLASIRLADYSTERMVFFCSVSCMQIVSAVGIFKFSSLKRTKWPAFFLASLVNGVIVLCIASALFRLPGWLPVFQGLKFGLWLFLASTMPIFAITFKKTEIV